MTILYAQGVCAFAAFVSLALVILIRRRRLAHEDIGPLFSTFMAASTLPVALHLCSFVLPMPRGPGTIVFPDLYALYISAAGLILLVSSGVTICQLFAARIRRESVDGVDTRMPPDSGAVMRDTKAPAPNRKAGSQRQ